MSDGVTPEMVLAVRKHECKMQGHRWDVIEAYGEPGPVAVRCSNCGEDSGLVQRQPAVGNVIVVNNQGFREDVEP